MKQLFWISLLLTHLAGTESKDIEDNCLSEPNQVIEHEIGENAVLPCSVTSHCSGQELEFAWFVFKHDSHHRLSVIGSYSMHAGSLHIRSVNINDSGIYHCAVESQSSTSCCQQYVGKGTTLVVKKQMKVRNILLWASFSLLLTYSLAVVALIILKKSGNNKKFSTKMSKLGNNNSRKQLQFRDVLQELHSRENLKRSKETRGNRSQVEAASDKCNISEDIYQNV
ncbi:immunoglobulin superfamily member 6 [Melanotaenia boesemani]|uniref:immunoglobulin superfamily member 6 n=1 Tax=Melanotaenia boesemani TaxID=1250792 RepID=UPI001C040ACE|nr:immunoglobulin superfamily member 6 [Melanotaenia boesemani]XP_041823527.1 immunoglobulin superfamily member 6 [Melanotaenia boesemani]